MLPTTLRAALALALLVLPGCHVFFPDEEDCRVEPLAIPLVDERVVVRVVEPFGAEARLYLDRVALLERGETDRIDRVVVASTAGVREAVAALGLERGDTVVVTTVPNGATRTGGYEALIPDWAANDGDCADGRYVPLHDIERIARP